MRKIRIIAVGKDKESWVTDGSAHYRKLLSKFASIEIELAGKAKLPMSATPDESRKAEAGAILSRLGNGTVIALWDRGEHMNSEGFAILVDKLSSRQRGVVTFVIGGAHGLDQRILDRADQCISLSALTFSHQVVRLVLLEQLYRAFTILAGSAYHK